MTLYYGDMTCSTNLTRLVQETKPAKICNVAVQRHNPDQLRNAGMHGQALYLLDVLNCREADGMRFLNDTLFNQHSSLRGEPFVTRKITPAVARISLRQQRVL